MQNRHHANPTTNVTGIAGQLEDRISGRFDEQAVDFFLMETRKSPKLVRHREDHVIIRYRQEFLFSGLEPCLDVTLVTLRATAIATGVVRILLLTTMVALKDMAPQGGRTALEYVLEGASMTGRHSFAELLYILVAVASEDVGHFDHGGSTVNQ